MNFIRAAAEGAPSGVLYPPVEGDARDDIGEEGVRGGADAGLRGEAAAARTAGDRGEGRGPGTAAGHERGCVHSCWLRLNCRSPRRGRFAALL